jgi:hypothetical protein
VNEVEAYVAEVRAALADLPAEVREELLEDLPEHLAEVAAEGDEPLRSRLGEPAQYAAELRATVALGQTAARRAPLQWATAVEDVRGRLRAADLRLGPLIGYAKASDYVRLLRPAWWLLRGYLAAMAVAYALDVETMGLLPRVGGGTPLALAILAGFLVGSVWLGRRHDRLRPWARYSLGVVSVYLAVLAVVGFAEVDDDVTGGVGGYYEVVDNSPYGNVQDVFPYDPNGRLLRDVRLFDQDGNPVSLGFLNCEPDADISNVYPRCPDQAPFTFPGASPTPTATVTPAPTATATPSPSATR